MQPLEPAGRLLGRTLEVARDDLGDAALSVQLLALPSATGQLDLGLLHLLLLFAQVGLGRAQGPFGRLPLDVQSLLVGGPAASVPGDLALAEFGCAVDPLQQVQIVADHDQGARAPGVHGVVQTSSGEQVEIVGGFVEQQHVGAFHEQRGQAQQHGFPAGEPSHGAVQPDAVQPQGAQGGHGAFLDVPVVADDLEVGLARVPGLDRVERGALVGDPQGPVHRQVGVQRDVLWQVGQVAVDGHRPVGRGEHPGHQAHQGRLARTVDADQTGASPSHGHGQAVEDGGAVGPAEGQVGAGHRDVGGDGK